ncbi:MAG: tetratricopeptide repeat protein [Sedimentisphaerales bacterium]
MSRRGNKKRSRRSSSSDRKKSHLTKAERRRHKKMRGPSKSASAKKKKQKSAERSPLLGLSARRLWVFRIVAAIFVPALFFALLEFGLRAASYGYRPAAILKSRMDGKTVYCDNLRFGWRFFPPNISREFTPFTFAENKADKTCRIFVLGASAAQGEPCPAFGFGRILKTMLQEEYPEVNFQVIVMAMAAINSHVVLEIAQDCARRKPDLFVVYLGNNEVVGPYGAGTALSPFSRHLSLIRAGIAIKCTRLGQLIASLLESLGSDEKKLRVWKGMEMLSHRQVRIDDPRLETVYAHFQRNIEDIIRLGRRAGAKVVLCTVGNNLKDNAPFGSLHRGDLSSVEIEKWKAVYEKGIADETDGAYDNAVKSYTAATETDDTYAELYYRLGRCYQALAEYEQARNSYVRARDTDTLRFRADSRINQIIRDIAHHNEANGVHLVDAVELFEQNSPNRIPGSELFLEHVHLNFHGNYLLAKAIFGQVVKLLPARLGAFNPAERPILTETECARRLAWTDWDRYKIADKVVNEFLKKMPFTNQLDHDQQVGQMEQDLAAQKTSLTRQALDDAAAQYQSAIEQNDSDWVLHERYATLLLEDLEDPRSALEQYRRVAELVPHSYLGYYNMGTALFKLGNLPEGIVQYNKAIQTKPTYGYAHYLLALAYRKTNEVDKAIRHYSAAIRRQPDLVPAYNDLAEIWMRQGKLDKAIDVCRRGIRLSTNNAMLHCNLGVLLNKQNHRDEAIEEIRKAAEMDPNSARIRQVLNAVLSGRR